MAPTHPQTLPTAPRENPRPRARCGPLLHPGRLWQHTSLWTHSGRDGTSREPPAPARRRARLSARLWLFFGPSMTAKRRPLWEPVTTAGACLRSGARSESRATDARSTGAHWKRWSGPPAEPARGGGRSCPTPEADRGACVCTEAGAPGREEVGAHCVQPPPNFLATAGQGLQPRRGWGPGGPVTEEQVSSRRAVARTLSTLSLRLTPPGSQRP